MRTRHRHPLITLLILLVALVFSGESGTKKPPAKAPQEPIDKMLALIRQGDPKDLIVARVQVLPGGNGPLDLQIVVNTPFHEAHYQTSYQLTQLWATGWRQLNDPAVYARVFITDRLGNIVARGTEHLTWVQQP